MHDWIHIKVPDSSRDQGKSGEICRFGREDGIGFDGLVGIRMFDVTCGEECDYRLDVGDYVVLGGGSVKGDGVWPLAAFACQLDQSDFQAFCGGSAQDLAFLDSLFFNAAGVEEVAQQVASGDFLHVGSVGQGVELSRYGAQVNRFVREDVPGYLLFGDEERAEAFEGFPGVCAVVHGAVVYDTVQEFGDIGKGVGDFGVVHAVGFSDVHIGDGVDSVGKLVYIGLGADGKVQW